MNYFPYGLVPFAPIALLGVITLIVTARDLTLSLRAKLASRQLDDELRREFQVD